MRRQVFSATYAWLIFLTAIFGTFAPGWAQSGGALVASAGNRPPPLAELIQRLDNAESELAKLRGELPQVVDQPMVTDATSVDSDSSMLASWIEKLERARAEAEERMPQVRLKGFFKLDTGYFNQDANSRALFGDIQDGTFFRRCRLQAVGNVTPLTDYSLEMDFAFPGRPSFMDVWVEQQQLPFFGDVVIGNYRQPITMEAWTNIKHLEFMERSMPFQAFDVFRRVGMMARTLSDDERTMLAYSVYKSGWTFWNQSTESDVYSTTGGDDRFATQIGDHGGYAFALRSTHLLHYDEPADGRYLLHVGGGYVFSAIGGRGTTGTDAQAYQARSIPEFYVGDQAAAGLTSAGTPFVADTGRFLATSYNLGHVELAGSYGPAHFQTEYVATWVNQYGGPPVFYDGAYLQGGYFLTGENCGYIKQMGALDYNVIPFSEFFGLGRRKGICGWGAWEVAFRWSYLNLNARNINPANLLPNVVGPAPNPNPGVVNDSTVALNWWWNQYTRVYFNWIHSMPTNQSYTSNTKISSTTDIFAVRMQIEF